MTNISFQYKDFFTGQTIQKDLPIITPDYPDMRTPEGMEFFITFMDLKDKRKDAAMSAALKAINATNFESKEQKQMIMDNLNETDKLPAHIKEQLDLNFDLEFAKQSYTDNQYYFDVYKLLVEKLFKPILNKDEDWKDFNWFDPTLPYKLIAKEYLNAYQDFFRASSSTGQNTQEPQEQESSISTEERSEETETQSQLDEHNPNPNQPITIPVTSQENLSVE